MKNLLTIIFMIVSVCTHAQSTNSPNTATDSTKMVTLITKFNESKMACKDGYFIEGYIVNINYNEAKKLDGKKVKITGQYTIVKGLKNQPIELDEAGNQIHKQGRLNDTKHIELPTVVIVD
jgi:hypothetical protein